MLQFQCLFAACLAMAVVPQEGVESLLTSSTQDAARSSQTEEPSVKKVDSAEESRINAEVAEIMAIRKRLGGGVTEALQDLSLEMPLGKGNGDAKGIQDSVAKPLSLEDEFAKQLAQQSRNSVAQEPANLGNWTIVEAQTSKPTRAKPSKERSKTIRHAARMLEEAAAILEEASEYNQADNIRQAAGELWRSARGR